MRKIKFRIWNSQFHKMSYHFPYILGENVEVFELKSTSTSILMQYTGLKDRNGKEIYEGDILKDIRGNKSKIIFFSIPADLAGMTWGWNLSLNEHPSECEMIGNIYKDPELLDKSY